MLLSAPRLVIAGLSGDGGKTLVAAGLARALVARGLGVAPFKKGPDYIDAGWLGAAARRPGRNLDSFLMPDEAIAEALRRGGAADLLLVEGNRGLYDGLDAQGSHSTARLARLIQAPVILVVDVAKTTRTAAAMVLGCRALDPELNIAGLVLNRVGSARHEHVVRDAVEAAGGPPVLGAIRRLEHECFPARHLGLLTAAEHPGREQALDFAAETVASGVELDRLLSLARSAPAVELPDRAPVAAVGRARIAVLRDEAFSFYYPENLEALEEAGAELVFVSPLTASALPRVDAVYAGGGFPEVHADRLSANAAFRRSLKDAASGGTPVYAECGGLIYLARQLTVGGVGYPMCGVLDLAVELAGSPTGHGYVEARVAAANPFFRQGTTLRGHEFHYSRVGGGGDRSKAVLHLERGTGLGGSRDGIAVGNVWASYLHVHALSAPSWAPALVGLAGATRGAVARETAPTAGACCG